jgi:hypothetical protein
MRRVDGEWWRIKYQAARSPLDHLRGCGNSCLKRPLPVMLSQAHARPSAIFVDEFDATSF